MKITDNREFWKTIKLFLSDRSRYTQKICFKEGNKVTSNDTDVANIMNKHFVDAVRSCEPRGGHSEIMSLA